MGTYCERHTMDAISKYIEQSNDDSVIVSIVNDELVCSNTDCDDEAIYVVSYHPKEQEVK